jgi:two-component sensor histidine kinase
MLDLLTLGIIVLFVLMVASSAIKIVQEYERGVIFRLGRLIGPKGPGIFFIIPVVDRMVRVDLRTITLDIPAQEAITNIAKHSRAETVLIQVLEREDQISIEIEDDGEGFDPSSLPPPAARERGLGLLGMRERVELFGGSIEIDSAPGRGTRIAVVAPLRQEVVHGQDPGSHRG